MPRIESQIVSRLTCLGIALIFIYSISGCSTGKVRIVQGDGFPGIESFYQEGFELVSIIQVHGMGIHESGDNVNIRFQDNLANQLGFRQKAKSFESVDLKLGSEVAGTLNTRSWSDENGKRLNIFELNWDPITRTIQQEMFGFSDDYFSPENQWKKQYSDAATINRLLKHFVNTSLSDAVIYVGDFGSELRGIIKDGLTKIANNNVLISITDKHAVVLITDSLGSTLTFDALVEIKQSSSYSNVKNRLNDLIKQVYMNANQLPLLELARIRLTEVEEMQRGIGGNRCQIDKAPKFGFYSENIDADQKLDVISITDPNDALSFPITEHYRKKYLCLPQTGISVNWNDIQAQNAFPYLGLIAHPVKVHSNGFKKSNKAGINAIVNGLKPGE